MAEFLRKFAGPGALLLLERGCDMTGYTNPRIAVLLWLLAVIWGLYGLATWERTADYFNWARKLWSLFCELKRLHQVALGGLFIAALFVGTWWLSPLPTPAVALPTTTVDPSKLTHDELGARLKEWAQHSNFEVNTRSDPNAYVKLFLEDRFDRPFTITVEKDYPNTVTIIADIRVAPEEFTSLSPQQQDALVTNLQIEMARLGVEWGGLGAPLDSVRLYDRTLAIDASLTERRFMERIKYIRTATILFVQVVRRALARNNAQGDLN